MSVTKKEIRLLPFMKYPGGKEKELKYILPNLPKESGDYYEPFIGGGAVYFAIDSEHYYINDKSTELVHLYQMVKEQNIEFLEKINEIERAWMTMEQVIAPYMEKLVEIYHNYKYSRCKTEEARNKKLNASIKEFVSNNKTEFNLLLQNELNVAIDNFAVELEKSFKNKITRMAKLEKEKGNLEEADIILNLEAAFKNAFYIHFRYLYNHIEELEISVPFATAIYYFIREYCYSSMFRYNQDGEFNVPYGGISYNRKSMAKKAIYFIEDELIEQLSNTVIENMDFEEFFKIHEPEEKDFIFLDPPYDSEFSTYAKNEFGKADQTRLANFLKYKCKANFMLIIKNTDFIRSLYPAGEKTANGNQLYVGKFDKKYVVSFQDRNDKDVEHLLITNYEL